MSSKSLGADLTSYGGGTQSTALMVLSATGRFDCPTFVLANVGADSENPATLRYLADYAIPYAEANGIEVHVLQKQRRGGGTDTLLGAIERRQRSIPFPMRMPGGSPGTRPCTADYKIKVVGRWTKARGFTEDNPARVAIGISADEHHRANSRRKVPHEVPVYPLLEHDPALTREDCAKLIRAAGLPVPPKSSCWFCPMHRPSEWLTMRQESPELFDKSVALERAMIERRKAIGKDPLYMTRFGDTLDRVIPEGVEMLPFADDDTDTDAACDSSACFT